MFGRTGHRERLCPLWSGAGQHRAFSHHSKVFLHGTFHVIFLDHSQTQVILCNRRIPLNSSVKYLKVHKNPINTDHGQGGLRFRTSMGSGDKVLEPNHKRGDI